MIDDPKRPERISRKTPLSIRISAESKDRLTAAALRSGRSITQEAELRLELSHQNQDVLEQAMELAFGGGEFAALLMTLCRVMTNTVKITPTAKSKLVDPQWEAGPYAYDQVIKAACHVLEAFRPEGDIELPISDKPINPVLLDLGRNYAANWLRVLADHQSDNPNDDFSRLKARLGDNLITRLKSHPDFLKPPTQKNQP